MLTLILGEALESVTTGAVFVAWHRLKLAIGDARACHHVTPVIVTTLGIGPARCKTALVDDHACVTIAAVIVGATAVIFRHVVFAALIDWNAEAAKTRKHKIQLPDKSMAIPDWYKQSLSQ